MKVVILMVMAGLVAVCGDEVTKLREDLLAAMERAASTEKLSTSGLNSLVLPSAVGEVQVTDTLQQEYSKQSLASIKYGPRPDNFELALGLLPPCGGTCWQGYRRGYCSFWWTGCGWGTPLYYAQGCCGRYCLCCNYSYIFGGGSYGYLAGSLQSVVESAGQVGGGLDPSVLSEAVAF